MNAKEIVIASAIAFVLGLCAVASPASLPAKAVIKGGEKVAAKVGLRVAGKGVVRGGAKLAAVTAEHSAAKLAAAEAAKGPAKYITAKNILAAGAATAMVVGAHEMADGVQQMGEGVKEAVVVNPEIAENVAGTVTAPVKYAAAAGCLALLAVGVWFVWPWVSLARNWSRVAAARRAAAMQVGAAAAGGAQEIVDVEPVPSASANAGFTRVEVVFMVSGFLLITALGVWRMVSSGDSSDASGRPALAGPSAGGASALKAKAAKRAEAVAKMRSEYIASIDRLYAEFQSDVESVAKSRFDAVRAGVPGVADKFGAFSRCRDLFAAIASDKLKGGNKTEQGIRRDLEADYYRGLYAARDRVQDCLATFVRNAEGARTAFKLALEAELASVALPGDDAYNALLVECGDRIEQQKKALLEGQVEAALVATFEAVCLRQTIAAVSRALGGTAARQAGTMVAGGGLALADGPSPVLDVIAGIAIAGCTAWSIWDVYRATSILPNAMRKALVSATDDCEAHTLKEVNASGEKIYRAYCNVLG